MNCKKHNAEIPMLKVHTDFGIDVGYYCALCYNFIPIDEPEIAALRDLLSKVRKLKK